MLNERRCFVVHVALLWAVSWSMFGAVVTGLPLSATASEANSALTTPRAAPAVRLRDRLREAQTAWLNGSLAEARRGFENLVALAPLADWSRAQREALHYGHLRLAQLADAQGERDRWLERAAVFASDLDAGPELFPPPLIDAYRVARRRVASKSELSLGLSAPAHESAADSSTSTAAFEPRQPGTTLGGDINLPPSTSPTSDSPSLESNQKWLWWGIGLLAVGAAVVIQHERSRSATPEVQPVKRTGF